jgi:hypothetical protein
VAVTGRAASAATVASLDLTNLVTSVAAGVSKKQPYADPSDAERQIAGTGLARLLIGDFGGAEELLAGLGFTVASDIDSVTGRKYALSVSETDTERAWGLYLVDASAPPGLCIAVPHPKSDARCEELALRLWRDVPGSVLAMAAVHRDANNETADHSHNIASVFHHLWITVVGPHGIPQIQVHGFRDDTAPEQVAVSTGIGPINPAAARIADEIGTTGLVTTRSWDGTADSTCGPPPTCKGRRPTRMTGCGSISNTTAPCGTPKHCGAPRSTPSPPPIRCCSPMTGPHQAGSATPQARCVQRVSQAPRGTTPGRITFTPDRWSPLADHRWSH